MRPLVIMLLMLSGAGCTNKADLENVGAIAATAAYFYDDGMNCNKQGLCDKSDEELDLSYQNKETNAPLQRTPDIDRLERTEMPNAKVLELVSGLLGVDSSQLTVTKRKTKKLKVHATIRSSDGNLFNCIVGDTVLYRQGMAPPPRCEAVN